jgi:hypothetical protein
MDIRVLDFDRSFNRGVTEDLQFKIVRIFPSETQHDKASLA